MEALGSIFRGKREKIFLPYEGNVIETCIISTTGMICFSNMIFVTSCSQVLLYIGVLFRG